MLELFKYFAPHIEETYMTQPCLGLNTLLINKLSSLLGLKLDPNSRNMNFIDVYTEIAEMYYFYILGSNLKKVESHYNASIAWITYGSVERLTSRPFESSIGEYDPIEGMIATFSLLISTPNAELTSSAHDFIRYRRKVFDAALVKQKGFYLNGTTIMGGIGRYTDSYLDTLRQSIFKDASTKKARAAIAEITGVLKPLERVCECFIVKGADRVHDFLKMSFDSRTLFDIDDYFKSNRRIR